MKALVQKYCLDLRTLSLFLVLLRFKAILIAFLDNRAIVLDHGNPSMKNQMKALAAAEGKFCYSNEEIMLLAVEEVI